MGNGSQFSLDLIPPTVPGDFLSWPRRARSFVYSLQKYISTLIDRFQAVIADRDATIQAQTARIQALEDMLYADSTNSSRPPSSDSPYKDKPGKGHHKKSDSSSTGEKKKRKARHPGVAQQLMQPTETRDHKPDVCPHCGGRHFENLTLMALLQQIELPEEVLRVIHNRVYQGKCTNCGHKVRGNVPTELLPKYGSRLSAFIAYTDSQTGTTRRQLEEMLRDVFGLQISQGALQNVIDRVSQATVTHYGIIGEGARQSGVNHVDETTWRIHGPIGKGLHWLWVMCNMFLAFFMISTKRDAHSFHKLIQSWKGILVSDDYAVYRSWEYGRQTCLAHMIRDARSLKDSSNPDAASCGKRLVNAFTALFAMEGTPPAQRAIDNLRRRFYRIALDYGDLPGKGGNLVIRIMKEFDAVCLWLRDPLVNRTNNHAERQLRSAVCKRKISIGSAAEKGERWIERNLSLRKTCAMNKTSYFATLEEAVRCSVTGSRPRLYWLRKAAKRCYYTSKLGQASITG